ncbi:MAG TPA: lysylphosphatidylglycerol synthase domain-containing protein [Stellaceae bacterium]|nr:lysylphosphatidylglycerol synthase domain-containing protein [Stellaceae bacterium]
MGGALFRLTGLLGLLGVSAATGIFIWQGVGNVAGAFTAAGIGIVWAAAFHLVPMLINARAWQVVLPKGIRPPLSFFFWTVCVREAVNNLLPVARIGGEVVSARLLMRHGLRGSNAAASLVLDMTLGLVSQFVFTLIGVALLLRHVSAGEQGLEIALGLAIVLIIIVMLMVIQHMGSFAFLARLFRPVLAERFVGHLGGVLLGGAATLDRTLHRLYRRSFALAACAAWQLLGWVAGAGEIWIALRALGVSATLLDAVTIEALIQALSSAAFVIPGALGVQEGGFLVIGEMLGLAPEICLALALARRARDILVFAPALILWQLTLGRRLLARG